MLTCTEPFNLLNPRQMERSVNYFCKPLLLACGASFRIDSVLAGHARFHPNTLVPDPAPNDMCALLPLKYNTVANSFGP